MMSPFTGMLCINGLIPGYALKRTDLKSLVSHQPFSVRDIVKPLKSRYLNLMVLQKKKKT